MVENTQVHHTSLLSETVVFLMDLYAIIRYKSEVQHGATVYPAVYHDG